MSRNRLARSHSGFTIIEVLIVLAIAGLITLIVFQAIPALTRGSANNARKNGVANVLQLLSRYELNNSGAMPGNNTFLNAKQIAYYAPTDVTICTGAYSVAGLSYASCPAASAVTDTEKVFVYNYQHCSSTVEGQADSAGSGYSDVVALYAVKAGNGTGTSQCQQL